MGPFLNCMGHNRSICAYIVNFGHLIGNMFECLHGPPTELLTSYFLFFKIVLKDLLRDDFFDVFLKKNEKVRRRFQMRSEN